jgi:tetratricopeptide (TPR) repeat protein
MEWTKTKIAVAAAIVAVPVIVTLILTYLVLKGPSARPVAPPATAQTLQSLRSSANARAQSGRWQEAAADLAQVIKADPSQHMDWWREMPLLIQSGKTADYKTQCKAMLDRFGQTLNPMIAERVAKSCLLLPSAVSPANLTRVGNVATTAVSLGTGSPWLHWFQCTRGLADYRQGRFTSALESMELAQKQLAQSNDLARDMCEAETYFISAMARHQLQQPDEARSALALGLSIVQTKLPALDSGNLGGSWYDTVTAYILMREAQAMVK